MPTVEDMKKAAENSGVPNPYTDEQIQAIIDSHSAFSLPGTVYVPEDVRGGDKDQREALIAHETEHQAQYQNGGNKEILEELIEEAQMGPKVYMTPGTLEYETQQIENKANEILEKRKNDGVKNK